MMGNLIKRKIYKYFNKIESWFVKRYISNSKTPLYLKDEFGNYIKLYESDNFIYLKENDVISDSYPMMRALDSKVRNSNITFDIGANIGITTMWLARNSRKVHCFEPEDENKKRLVGNLKVNNFKNIVVNSTAVSNSNGSNTLYIHKGKGHHSLAPVGTTQIVAEEKVSLITLDEYCKQRKIGEIDVLKVDVEGFEKEVFEGAEDLLKNKAIKLIIFEISHFIMERLHKEEAVESIYNLLTNNSYFIFDLDGNKLNLSDLKGLDQGDVYASLNKKID